MLIAAASPELDLRQLLRRIADLAQERQLAVAWSTPSLMDSRLTSTSSMKLLDSPSHAGA